MTWIPFIRETTLASLIVVAELLPPDGLDAYTKLGATLVVGAMLVYVIRVSLPEKDKQMSRREKEHRDELVARDTQHRMEIAEREQQHRKEMQERDTLHKAAMDLQRLEFIARIDSGEKNFLATLNSIREANTKEREQNQKDRASMQKTLRQFARLEKVKAAEILQSAGEREVRQRERRDDQRDKQS